MNNPIIVWLRQDLRLTDNPALHFAVETGKPILPVFIFDEVSEGVRPMGAAQHWWLHYSLKSLSDDLKELGAKLILRRGPAESILQEITASTGADSLFWNRRYGEGEQNVDRNVKSNFKGEAKSFAGMLLHEPSKIRTGSGNPYKVYTPFWKNFISGDPPRKPYPRPEKLNGFKDAESETLIDWKLLPTKPDWSGGIADVWQPGETGAAKRVKEFLNDNIDEYGTMRDLPGPNRTSRLSPHLRFGEISPYQCWEASFTGKGSMDSDSRVTWRKELVWREFSYHLLQEWPDLATENFQDKFDAFPWDKNDEALKRWQTGQTGYPIVDAGMRQLWQTGWMHNRVRMIVGSFLVKHLLLDWRHGESWFWDTLVDGDPAANPAQWQWVAGTGADAAPYFRIFNPIMQAEKFDKEGEYIHHYVPELSKLDAKCLAEPWEAPEEVLKDAGVKLGETYPRPIVDHKEARERALEALNEMKSG